jgi:hypothetical protein
MANLHSGLGCGLCDLWAALALEGRVLIPRVHPDELIAS